MTGVGMSVHPSRRRAELRIVQTTSVPAVINTNAKPNPTAAPNAALLQNKKILGFPLLQTWPQRSPVMNQSHITTMR